METKSSANENELNSEFIQTVNQSLDQSLNDIDELSLQRLKNARVKALRVKSTPPWVALGVAASVAALVFAAIAMHPLSNKSPMDSEWEIVSQDIPLSAEEMDDIEMLMALEDTDA